MCPNDFPVSDEPILEDSQLAVLIHQMPENNESFLTLLRDAGPSPVKSVASDNWGSFDLEFLDDGDFHDFGLNSTFPTDFGDLFQGVNSAVEAQTIPMIHHSPPTSTHDLYLDSSAVSLQEVVDHPLGDAHASASQPKGPNPTTSQQPAVTTKNTGAPRKRNSKGKLECTARGCTKFVLAAKCKSQMCKGHCVTNGGCQDHGGGKGNSDSSLENSAPVPMALAGDNHWALSRPPSAIPLQPITSSATNNIISVNQTNHKVTHPEKMFRTEMSPAHEAAWRQKKQSQLEALESKSLKAEYERRYQNQVVVIFWDKVGSSI